MIKNKPAFVDCYGDLADRFNDKLASTVPGLEVFYDKPANEDELIKRLQGRKNVMVYMGYMSSKVLNSCPDLKTISYLSTGLATHGDLKESAKLGIRFENTRITLDQPTTGDFSRKKINGLFPTVNLNYEISDSQSVTLGYNRRIRRPRGFMLNPFPSRSSITNVFQGNPDLNPTFASTFELGYLNKLDKLTISSSIYYSHSTDIMTFVSRKTDESVIVDGAEFPVIERGPVNLGKDKRYGFEFNLNYNPSRKWRMNTDFNIFKSEREGRFDGVDLSANNLSWRARFTNKITLPHNIDWQTNINYRGPSQDAQNDRKGVLTTSVAFSKDLFKEKASIAFNVRDIFNKAFYSNDITAETFTAYQEIQFRGGRTFNLAFTYRFNQKKKRERQGGFDGGGMEM